MSKLNLDINKIAKARKFALDIAKNTQDFIEQHTTVTVERTVTRLLGIDGVDEFGVPYPNIVVDFIKKNGNISYGVSIYLATSPLLLSMCESSSRILFCIRYMYCRVHRLRRMGLP